MSVMVCRVQIWESYFWCPVKEYCHAKCMFTIIVTSHCVVWCSFLYQSTWLSSLSIVIEQDGRGIRFSIWGVHFVLLYFTEICIHQVSLLTEVLFNSSMESLLKQFSILFFKFLEILDILMLLTTGKLLIISFIKLFKLCYIWISLGF